MSRLAASPIRLTLPCGSAKVPRMMGDIDRKRLVAKPLDAVDRDDVDQLRGRRRVIRPPSSRGSTKVPSPTWLRSPGRPAPISRYSCISTPAGSTYASILSARASSCIRGDHTQCPPMTRLTIPSCAKRFKPIDFRSPMPSAWTSVRDDGWRVARNRCSIAANTVLASIRRRRHRRARPPHRRRSARQRPRP
jgi:hypothetical protein